MKEIYNKKVLPELKAELKLTNALAAPRFQKIVVNIGIGSYLTRQNKKDYETIADDLKMITGQKPVLRKAKKAISNFKLRMGMPVGLVCTLRGQRMYDFLNRLVNIAFPRIRDFQGLTVKGFDERGTYSIGVKEHTMFPEINVENVTNTHGLQINVVTTGKNRYETYLLLKKIGFPFRDEVSPLIKK